MARINSTHEEAILTLSEEATISVNLGGITAEGRTQFEYAIKVNGREYVGNDMHSGVGTNESALDGLGGLLSFILASMEGGENADLFPEWVKEMLEPFDDELNSTWMELDSI